MDRVAVVPSLRNRWGGLARHVVGPGARVVQLDRPLDGREDVREWRDSSKHRGWLTAGSPSSPGSQRPCTSTPAGERGERERLLRRREQRLCRPQCLCSQTPAQLQRRPCPQESGSSACHWGEKRSREQATRGRTRASPPQLWWSSTGGWALAGLGCAKTFCARRPRAARRKMCRATTRLEGGGRVIEGKKRGATIPLLPPPLQNALAMQNVIRLTRVPVPVLFLFLFLNLEPDDLLSLEPMIVISQGEEWFSRSS